MLSVKIVHNLLRRISELRMDCSSMLDFVVTVPRAADAVGTAKKNVVQRQYKGREKRRMTLK